ncbi:MAG: YdbH domain-containing protein [Candidatus Brocadiia bacterium]
MRRALKWAVRGGGVLALLAAVVLALYVAVLPPVVTRLAVDILEGMGLRDVSLELRGLSPSHAELASVVAGDERRLRVAAVGIHYRLPELARGRMGLIEVTGLETEMRLRDGVFDPGPLADMSTGGAGDVPFEQILLRAATVVLDVEGTRFRIPLEGTVTDIGEGRVDVALRLQPQGADLRVNGTLDTNTYDFDLQAAGEVPDAAGPLAALRRFVPVPGSLAGPLTFEARVLREHGEMALAATLAGQDLSLEARAAGRRLWAEGVSVDLRARTGADLRPTRLSGQVDAERAELAGVSLRGVRLRLRKEGEGLAFRLAARGDGWRLESLEGTGHGLLPGAGGGASGPPRVEASLRARGRLPPPVVSALRERGLAAEGLGEATVAGRATLAAGEPWALVVPELRVDLAEGDAAAPAYAAAASGLAAQLHLAAQAGPRAASVRLLPQSSLQVAEARAGDRGAEVAWRSDTGRTAVTLRLDERPVTLDLSRDEDGSWDWEARLPAARLELRGGRAAAASPQAVAEGLACTLLLTGRAGPRGATLEVLPASSLTARQAVATLPGLNARWDSAERPALALRVADRPAELSFSPAGEGGAWTWAATAPDLRLEARGGAARRPADGVAAEGVRGEARLSLAADSQGARMTILSGSRLLVDALEADGAGIRLAPVEPQQPALTAQLGADATAAAGPDGWEVSLPRADLRLAPTDVRLPEGATARAVAASLSLAATADPQGLEVRTLDGCWAGMGSAELAAGERTLRAGPARLGLGAPEGPPLVEVKLDGGRATTVAGRLLAETKAAVTAALSDGIEGSVGSLRASLDIDRADGATTLAARAEAGGIEACVERQGVTARLADAGLRAAARRTLGPGGEPTTVDFDFRTSAEGRGAEASFAGARAALGSVRVQGSAALGPKGAPSIDATVEIGGGTFEHEPTALRVAGVKAKLPVTLNRATRPPGRFAVDVIRLGPDTLPSLSGTIAVADWRAEATAAWPLLEGATLQAEGLVDFGRRLPRGELRASLPRFQFHETNQPARLLSALKGLEVSGALEADARLEVGWGRIEPRVRLTLEDGSLASKDYDAAMEGVDAKIMLTGLAPLTTPGSQRVHVARAHLGKLRVKDGFLAFRVDGADSFFIEQTRWGWAGGNLYTHAVRVNPRAPDLEFVVYADHLELSQLLALILRDEVTGEGTLYGRLPVTVRWPRISYRTGFLYATPGWGHIQVAEPVLEKVLRTGSWHLNQILERPRAALQDFEYSMFKTDFIVEGGRKVARVRAFGKSPRMPEPWEYKVDVNVFGFDSLLNAAIIIERARGSISDRLSGQ